MTNYYRLKRLSTCCAEYLTTAIICLASRYSKVNDASNGLAITQWHNRCAILSSTACSQWIGMLITDM